MKKEKTNYSFEHNLYLALKSHGFLFPNDAKEIANLEKDINLQSDELPLEFENGNFVQKRTKVIRLNSEEAMGKKSVKYAKVAAKRGGKKKK